MWTVSELISKFEKESRALLIDPSIEISVSSTLRVNVTGGEQYASEKVV